jgi:dihydrofolate reductase
MRKIVAGLAMSLDGVVHRPTDWMSFGGEAGEIISAGIAQADAILMGRSTYLEFAELWPPLGDSSPMARFLNTTPKYVMSATLTSLDWPGSTLITRDDLVRLKARPGKNIQIPGSPRLVASLLRDGLLDELGLMIPPLIVGSGLRLFDSFDTRLGLELVESRTLGGGVLSVTYRPESGKMG